MSSPPVSIGFLPLGRLGGGVRILLAARPRAFSSDPRYGASAQQPPTAVAAAVLPDLRVGLRRPADQPVASQHDQGHGDELRHGRGHDEQVEHLVEAQGSR
jgi:hypothetical protein